MLLVFLPLPPDALLVEEVLPITFSLMPTLKGPFHTVGQNVERCT